MEFENAIASKPGLKDQLVAHVPIVLLVVGVAVLLFSMHFAAIGVAALAAAHIAAGLAVLVVRHFRQSGKRA